MFHRAKYLLEVDRCDPLSCAPFCDQSLRDNVVRRLVILSKPTLIWFLVENVQNCVVIPSKPTLIWFLVSVELAVQFIAINKRANEMCLTD